MVHKSKMTIPGLIRTRRILIIGTFLLGLLTCYTSRINCAAPRVFEFAIHGLGSSENFLAISSDPAVVMQCVSQMTLPISERRMHINGAIDSTNGGFNYDWHWHFIPDQWELAEFSIELCDGLPSMVEQDLLYWVKTLGHFCPWGSYVWGEIWYICGDANSDNHVNVGDVVFLNQHIFHQGPAPDLITAGDANCDGNINVGDAVYLVNYVFLHGAPAPCADCP